jgi:V/A-type H+-transporting ATPase subunit D
MELLKLRARLTTARKGHKLLKDKLDELMKVFLAAVRRYGGLRAELEVALGECYELFAVAEAEVGHGALERVLSRKETCEPAVGDADADVDAGLVQDVSPLALRGSRRILNTVVPVLEFGALPALPDYSLAQTPSVLDEALERMQQLLPKLLSLAEQERTLEILGAELKAARRRVNALEHILIPQLETESRTIVFRLDEANREERTRLLKIKDLSQS